MKSDVFFVLIPLIIIAGVLLYLIIAQRKKFQQLHNEIDELNSNITRLISEAQSSRDIKYDDKEKIERVSSKSVENHRVRVLETNDFDLKVKSNDRDRQKKEDETNNGEIDFGQKYLFNHFSNRLTERNRDVEVVKKLK
jgi:hypothetical protein